MAGKDGTCKRCLDMWFHYIVVLLCAITTASGQCTGVLLTDYQIQEYGKANPENKTSHGCLDPAKTYHIALKNSRTVTSVRVNSGNLLQSGITYSYNSSTWLQYTGRISKPDTSTILFEPPIFLQHLVVTLGPISGPIGCLNISLTACVEDIVPTVSFQSTTDALFFEGITLVCTIKGQPFADIVWRTLNGFIFHTRYIENQFDIRGDSHNSTLRLTKARLSEDGFVCRAHPPPCMQVICVASYPGSTKMSSVAKNLNVYPASPEQLRMTRIWPKSVVTTWRKPEADMIMNYTFFGIALTSDQGPRRENIPVLDLKATDYNNVLRNLRPCTFYAIEVSSVNYLGESIWTRSNFTTTAGLLGVNLRIGNVSSTSVATTWDVQEVFGSGCRINNATMFLIRYQCLDGLSDLDVCKSLVQVNASRYLRSVIVARLNPATRYQVSVTAHTTQVDYNVSSQAIEFVTKDASPTGTPNNFRLTDINRTSVSISWEDIRPKYKHGKILYFKVRAARSNQNATVFVQNTTATTNSTTITGLQPCTVYSLFVSGCNSAGCGPSAHLSFRTRDRPINASLALSLNLNESDPRNIFLTASTAVLIEGEHCVAGYTVQYREESEGNLTETKRTAINQSVSISDLRPFSTYLVRSRLNGYSSVGPWTQFLRVRTEEGVPSAVRNLRLSPRTPDVVHVTWDAPSQPNGVIANHTVEVLGTRSYNASFIHFGSKSTGNITELTLSGLLPATFYNITVQASNRRYEGVTAGIAYETAAKPPLQPSPVVFDESTVIYSQIRATARQVHAVNGPISEYQVIVMRGGGTAGFVDGTAAVPNYHQALARNISYYMAVKLPAFSGFMTFLIGDGKTELGHLNAPLSRNFNYTVFIRAVTRWQGKTLYSNTSAAHLYRYPVERRPSTAPAGRKMTSVRIQLIQLQQHVQYARIVVQKLDSDNRITSVPHPDQYAESNITVYAMSKQSQFSLPYVTAELSRAFFDQHETFDVGNGNRTSRTTTRKRRSVVGVTSFWNGPLDPGSSYIVFFRVYHSDLVFFSSGWSAPFSTLPSEPTDAVPKGSGVGLVIGVVLCVLAIPCFIIVGILMWKRYRKAFEASCQLSNLELVTTNSTDNNGTANHSFSDDAFDPEVNEVNTSNFALQYPIDLSHPPIPTVDYIDYIDAMKDKDYAFEDEFQELNDGQSGSKRESKKDSNAALNRDADCVPFDCARVILERERKSESDYINAAFVSSFDVDAAYIATQAPLSQTVKDFWVMVWQQNVRTIVMLTHVLDDDKADAPCYWPSKQKLVLGDLTIESKDTVFDDCSAVRAFVVAAKKAAPRLVRHFQFNKWPERGVPSSVNSLLTFRDMVDHWQKGKNSPMVIHCSNGCGRTGTFIALDALLKNFRTSKTVDIFNYVNYQRSRRTRMVQTDRQYEFIYDAVLEVLVKHDTKTEMTKRNSREVHRSLITVDPLTGCSGFGKIFKMLHRGLKRESSIIKHFEGSKAINDYKNRYSFKVPHDSFRVRLPVFGSAKSNSSDYINATLVSLSDSSRFITTQAPFGITINDFWTMVHFSRADVIVSLNDLEEGQAVFTQYWPSGEMDSAVYGNFKVALELETTPFPCVIRRDFTLSELGHPDVTKEVTQFHMLGWLDHDTPTSRIAVLELCKHIVSEHMAHDKPPVMVQCSDGFGRSGTFCACAEAIKGMMGNGIVDIQNIVRKFKERNTAYIENEAQFKFIFDLVLDYSARRD